MEIILHELILMYRSMSPQPVRKFLERTLFQPASKLIWDFFRTD